MEDTRCRNRNFGRRLSNGRLLLPTTATTATCATWPGARLAWRWRRRCEVKKALWALRPRETRTSRKVACHPCCCDCVLRFVIRCGLRASGRSKSVRNIQNIPCITFYTFTLKIVYLQSTPELLYIATTYPAVGKQSRRSPYPKP